MAKIKTLLLFFSVLILIGAAHEGSNRFDALMGKGTKHWQHVQQPQDLELLQRSKFLFERKREAGGIKIPQTVHFIWLGPRSFPRASVENVRRWIAEHPHWTFKFWTDRERDPPCKGMETIVIKKYPFPRLGRCYEASENWGEKSDLLRYEILFHQGGVYADHDMKCLRSFEDFHKTYDFYCGLEPPHPAFVGWNVTVGNGLIGSKPGHPVLRRVMDLIERRWDELAQKYPGSDGFSRTQIVMERTYIAFTHAVMEKIDQPGWNDVIMPAAYFFAKKGITPLYSEHFYANTWADFGGKDLLFERGVQKTLLKLEKKYTRAVFFALGSLSFNLLLLGFVILFTRKARSTCIS